MECSYGCCKPAIGSDTVHLFGQSLCSICSESKVLLDTAALEDVETVKFNCQSTYMTLQKYMQAMGRICW